MTAVICSKELITQDLGGNYYVDTLGAFLSFDYDLTDQIMLTAGTRYSYEKRKAETCLRRHSQSSMPCNVAVGPECQFDFTDEETWNSWSPKLGVAYYLGGGESFEANIYGHWTRGYRSGGYNLRNTYAPDAGAPGTVR